MKLNNKDNFIWETSSKIVLPDIPDKKLAWNRLKQNMAVQNIEKKHSSLNLKNKLSGLLKENNNNYNTNIAATYAIILLVLSITTFNLFTVKKKTTQLAQKENILLVDGSQIILNSESKIIYDRNYNIDNRLIKLDGEAYFKVQKNSLPFIINTDYGEVTVLGTSFNVRSRKDGFEVGVNEGKVLITTDSTSIQLLKGQQINITKTLNSADITKILYKNYPDWINQKMYCNNTTLEELCNEIERTFDIKIEFSNPSLKNITLSGIIIATDIDEVLQTVSLLTQHKFKLIGDIYTFI